MSRIGIFQPYKKTDKTHLFSTEKTVRYTTPNTGNMMFKQAVGSHLKSHIAVRGFQANLDELKSSIDVLIMPVANQINPGRDLSKFADFLKRLNKNVIVVGLGAQNPEKSLKDFNLKKGTIEYLKVISDLSYKIGVRGEFTADVLGKYGVKNVVLTGCPSNFVNPNKNLGEVIEKKIRTLLVRPQQFSRAGFYPQLSHNALNAKHRNSDIKLFNFCNKYSGFYMINNPNELISMARGRLQEVDREYIKKINAFIAPDLPYQVFLTKLLSNAITFTSIDSWKEFSSTLSLSIGKRIHGALCSVQSKVPGIIVTHDSRTEELSESIGLPRISLDLFEKSETIQQVLEQTVFSGKEYDMKRKFLLRNYLSIFNHFNIPLSKDITTLSEKIA